MSEISLFRLYLLRAVYLLLVVGLGILLWPGLFDPARRWVLMEGQEPNCMLAAFSILCLFGLRYPLQMLPALIWEALWKTLWLASVPLPQWLGGHLDPALQPMVLACSMVVLVYIAIPWPYVFTHYVTARGDRWMGGRRQSVQNTRSWT